MVLPVKKEVFMSKEPINIDTLDISGRLKVAKAILDKLSLAH
jgi:hypothetical protein